MDLSTYAELAAEVVSRSHRDDTLAQVPACVALCEARLNRLPRLRTMETEATLACTVGSRFVALPADYESPVQFWLVNTDREPLTPRLPQDLCISSDNSYPEQWAVDGSSIAMDCPADQAYPAILRYLARFALDTTDANSTNWLLQKNPDVYLYGTLAELADWQEDAEMEAKWRGKYGAALGEVTTLQSRQRKAVLTTELAGAPRSNILRGW